MCSVHVHMYGLENALFDAAPTDNMCANSTPVAEHTPLMKEDIWEQNSESRHYWGLQM